MMNGERVFTMKKMKESSNGRNGIEDCQDGNGSHFYAVVDHPIYGNEFCSGSLDDVRAFIRAYGDGSIFCSVRVFTLH